MAESDPAHRLGERQRNGAPLPERQQSPGPKPVPMTAVMHASAAPRMKKYCTVSLCLSPLASYSQYVFVGSDGISD